MSFKPIQLKTIKHSQINNYKLKKKEKYEKVCNFYVRCISDVRFNY